MSLRENAIALTVDGAGREGRLLNILFLNHMNCQVIRVLVTAIDARDKMRSWPLLDRAIRVVGI